jgi:hypothetical protein
MLQHFIRGNTLRQGGIVLYSNPNATVNTTTTYTIKIPDTITNIAGLAIGAGGGGGGASTAATASAGGGGGGALSYSNSISVTPGESLTVVVPNQSAAGSNTGGNGGTGGTASLARGGTTILSALGGAGSLGRTSTTGSAGALGGAAASGVGTVKYSGGTGGAGVTNDQSGGGGSAAGYGGNGVTGGTNGSAGACGSGGSGGAGGSYLNNSIGGSGGGTLWYGYDGSGSGGGSAAYYGALGSSWSGGGTVFSSPLVIANNPNVNGFPGGGGAGAPSGGCSAYYGMRGAGGLVRLLWGPNIDFGIAASNVKNNQLYVRSSNTSLTSTIAMPSVELGDTAIFIDYSENASGAPTAVTPTGFSVLLNTTSGTRRLTTYYKQILSSAETSTSLTGANGTAYNAKIIVIISGQMGASFSPLGNDTALNGAVGTSNSGATLTYGIDALDCYAHGIPVGFCFFNSGAALYAGSMDYTGSIGTTTLITTSDSRNYLKVGLYPVTPLASYYTGTINLLSSLSTNTYAFWNSNFF